jgi:8-oxo-dGTP pyrophosphatase MutT (NUDIX family)
MKGKHTLSSVTAFLQQRLSRALPGASAHELMRAQPVGNLRPIFKNEVSPRPGGVLILLYEKNGEIYFPLIKRPEYGGHHSGQVSFPGGKAEKDEDRIMAALREGEEEIGIHRESVTVIGQLSDFHVIPSNFLVTPVIGILNAAPVFTPDPVEVAKILSVSLDDLTKADGLLQGEIVVNGYKLLAPHFMMDGEMVWGATAMILSEFKYILNEID